MTKINLNDFLGSPRDLAFLSDDKLESLSRDDIAAFQFEAARRNLERQAKRIPVLGDMLAGNDPSSFENFEDFLPFLFKDGAYKSYDLAFIQNKQFDKLTQWLSGYTTHDLSGVDMEGCDSLTEWCRRLHEQVNIFICHSTGTSGVLSFLPRSQKDRDLVVDSVIWNSPGLFDPNERNNDVSFFTLSPRRQYRITQALYDGLEERFLLNPVQVAFEEFMSPELSIAMGKLRKANEDGTLEECFKDPAVAACAADVQRFVGEAPEKIKRWIDNIKENYIGKRIYFMGTFDRAWEITQSFKEAGITEAFAPESVFALFGGVKLGTELPDDWQDQFKLAMGTDKITSGWGMTELATGAAHQCSQGMFHFFIHTIPILLDPKTGKPLPRKGVQTGQIAVLQLVSEDCWGGVITGDLGTVYWDRVCDCGMDHGPLLDPESLARL